MKGEFLKGDDLARKEGESVGAWVARLDRVLDIEARKLKTATVVQSVISTLTIVMPILYAAILVFRWIGANQ